MTLDDYRAQLAWLRYYQDIERFNRTLKGMLYDGVWRVARVHMHQSKRHKRWAYTHFVQIPLMRVDGPTIIQWKDWAATTPFESFDVMIEYARDRVNDAERTYLRSDGSPRVT